MTRFRSFILLALVLITGGWVQAGSVWAHGFAGQRFFPEPLAMEDPFAADEMDLAALSFIRGNDARDLSIGAGLQKRITPTIGISISSQYDLTNPLDPTAPNSRGFTNPEFGVKWVPYINGPHETVIGLQFSFASNIGNRNISEPHGSLAPQISVGKGFGDLPNSLPWLRPLAVEGAVSLESPIGATAPEGSALHYNLVVQYSLIYLQSFVKDVGIPWPFNRFFPQCEFGFSTPLAGDTKGRTEAFAYPGAVWAGKFFELGLEAQVPLNRYTGNNVGVLGLVHLFLDDMMPTVFHPIVQ